MDITREETEGSKAAFRIMKAYNIEVEQFNNKKQFDALYAFKVEVAEKIKARMDWKD